MFVHVDQAALQKLRSDDKEWKQKYSVKRNAEDLFRTFQVGIYWLSCLVREQDDEGSALAQDSVTDKIEPIKFTHGQWSHLICSSGAFD